MGSNDGPSGTEGLYLAERRDNLPKISMMKQFGTSKDEKSIKFNAGTV